MKYEFKALNLRPEWEWIAERAKCNYCEDTKGIVAYKGLDIVACVAFDSWSFNSVFIHLAIEDPFVLRHGYAEECFGYIFNKCNRNIILGATPADRDRVLKFNAHMGFEEIYRVKDGYDIGTDYVIQELRKENCRYISHGKEVHTAAA